MKILRIIQIVFAVLLVSSCNHSINRAMRELQNMPAPDYSYVVQPNYSIEKEAIESKIKEIYSSEEVKVGAIGMHGYDNETKAQKDEEYWFKVILLNSKAIIDLNDESRMDKLGKEVAKSVITEIKNIDMYDKIQVTFVEQWNDGTQKQMKQNIFYTLPELEVTELFDNK